MKTLIAALLFSVLSLAISQHAHAQTTMTLLDAKITTGAGDRATTRALKPLRTVQGWGTTTAGSGASSINVEASNDGTNYKVIGNITLTLGVTATNDAFVSYAPWPYMRGNVASISGTNAAVTLTVGE